MPIEAKILDQSNLFARSPEKIAIANYGSGQLHAPYESASFDATPAVDPSYYKGKGQRKLSQALLTRVNLPWNLDTDIRFHDFRKNNYPAASTKIVALNAVKALQNAHDNLKKTSLKVSTEKKWTVFGKKYAAKLSNTKRTKTTPSVAFIISKLSIAKKTAKEEKEDLYLAFFNKRYDLPFSFCRILTKEGKQLFTVKKELTEGKFNSYKILDEALITSSNQKIQLRYVNGSMTTVKVKNLIKAIEEKDALLLRQISTIEVLQKGQAAKPHPFLDPLVMVYRSLRGDYENWKPDYSFTKSFIYEKVRWRSPDDNLVKFMVGLHLRGRKDKIRFKGGLLNYKDMVKYRSSAPINRDYSKWTEQTYAFSNSVIFIPKGPDPNYAQLVMHRSLPTYQDERTTLFKVTFSIIKEGKEERIYLTGNRHENIRMVSNTYADELGDNYLHGDSYTLSFEPMPSHLEWDNTIRVTDFGVFIHRGVGAKRYAGCKGLTSIFDFSTMSMPIWESMRSLNLLKGLHDKYQVPAGNFWLKNNSYAPGASANEGTPIVLGESLIEPTTTL